MTDFKPCTKQCHECSNDPLIVCRMHYPLMFDHDAERTRKLEQLCLRMWGFIAKMPNLFMAADDQYMRFAKELKELEVIG